MICCSISEEEARRRPSIRTLTIRYILAHLKYLHKGGKIDILKIRPICTGLFHHLRDDPTELAKETLSVTEQHILKDDELPRSAKSALLVQQNLERVTELATRLHDDNAAAEAAFEWLKSVCTIPLYGVLRTSRWYPPGTAKTNHDRTVHQMIDLGLDSIDFYDRASRPDVRNITLLTWIHNLRPQSNTRERELVLTCFGSAPELVAAYFAERNLQLEPKLSNTWMGYASFLFEVVQLPVPDLMGNETDELAQLPPQTNVMIESILPRPLTQKALTKCLNQSSELIMFFTVRLLVLAFQKLTEVRSQLSKCAAGSSKKGHAVLWHDASERLVTRFTERCPAVKDVMAAFRKKPDNDEHALQREALTRLLELYFEVTPLEAMEDQFDVSAVLTAALLRQEATQDSGQSETGVRELRALELEHLLQIARQSTGMRWVHKQGALRHSPILTLLRIHSKDVRNRSIRGLINHVLTENNILDSTAACDALVTVLGQDICSGVEVYEFLDDCFLRATRKPVKYLDDLEAVAASTYGTQVGGIAYPDAFTAVLLEQAPFIIAKPKDTKDQLEAFVNSYIELLMHDSERADVLESIRDTIAGLEGFNWVQKFADPGSLLGKVRLLEPTAVEAEQPASVVAEDTANIFDPVPKEPEDHPELVKWARKDLDMSLEDGDIDALILCLCSRYQDVRTQALTQLHKLESGLLNSSIEDKDPIYVLLGELLETYEQHYLPSAEALPYLAGTFAAHALRVQMEPTHLIYPKVNQFLNKGPEWRINKLPSYWLKNTNISLPEQDDAYWREVQWVLDWFVDGLRTPADLETLRRAAVFEKAMSLFASPGAAAHKQIRHKVQELLWRATFVDGGSTTIVTRAGVLSWLDYVKGKIGEVETVLRQRIVETFDREKIKSWSGLEVDEL